MAPATTRPAIASFLPVDIAAIVVRQEPWALSWGVLMSKGMSISRNDKSRGRAR